MRAGNEDGGIQVSIDQSCIVLSTSFHHRSARAEGFLFMTCHLFWRKSCDTRVGQVGILFWYRPPSNCLLLMMKVVLAFIKDSTKQEQVPRLLGCEDGLRSLCKSECSARPPSQHDIASILPHYVTCHCQLPSLLVSAVCYAPHVSGRPRTACRLGARSPVGVILVAQTNTTLY